MIKLDLETIFAYKYHHAHKAKDLRNYLEKQGDLEGLELLNRLDTITNLLVAELDRANLVFVQNGKVKIDEELEYYQVRYTLNRRSNPLKALKQLGDSLNDYAKR